MENNRIATFSLSFLHKRDCRNVAWTGMFLHFCIIYFKLVKVYLVMFYETLSCLVPFRPHLCQHTRLCLCAGHEEEGANLPASFWAEGRHGFWVRRHCFSELSALLRDWLGLILFGFKYITVMVTSLSATGTASPRHSGGWRLGPSWRSWPSTTSSSTHRNTQTWSMWSRRGVLLGNRASPSH